MFQEVQPKPVGLLVSETNSHSRAEVSRPVRTTVDGLILAGTHSWGDDILERVAPKPLWPVALVPLIAHGIQWLNGSGVSAACICANSETSILRARFGAGESLNTPLT